MTVYTMRIHSMTRFPNNDLSDTLSFMPGVNVIVGPPNTGKTQWLKILDYLLGNDSKAENIFSDEVFEKYESATLTVSIAGEKHIIERSWKKQGVQSKVIIDGETLSITDYLCNILTHLKIPILHYPQGNPYGPRTWPELGFRSLLRHIYRQQRFWTGLADKQPESEQHACLMQFVGIAKDLFSEEYGKLIGKEKKIEELRYRHRHYLSILEEVSHELIDAEEIGIALTPQSIEMATEELQNKINEKQKERHTYLEEQLESITMDGDLNKKEKVQQLGEELVELQLQRDNLYESQKKVQHRLSELEEYHQLVDQELSRINRTKHASEILAAIKITHCPACDKKISNDPSNPNECLLCHRPLDIATDDLAKPSKRIEFEEHQLHSESNEARELIHTLDHEKLSLESQISRLDEQIHQIQTTLKPTRETVSAIIHPELGIYDMEIGRLEERLRQLKRIEVSLRKQEKVFDEINNIQREVEILEDEVETQNSKIDFDKEANVLANSINSYLNQIKKVKPMFWSQRPVRLDFRKRDFRFSIGERKWESKLGGTATLIFIMAYHYGLLSLSNKQGYNYPGLLIIDFPAELADGTTVRDKENFVLDPFVNMLKSEKMSNTQVIAAGSAFENLEGANRIELRNIWV